MKHTKLRLLTTTLMAMSIALPALAQECATEPVTVGLLPKLDTDPYFQIHFGGAQEAAAEATGGFLLSLMQRTFLTSTMA